MSELEIYTIFDEYYIYQKDKHALPFKIWLKYKKKFDSKTISQIYELMEDADK